MELIVENQNIELKCFGCIHFDMCAAQKGGMNLFVADSNCEYYRAIEDVRQEIAKETLKKLYNFACDNWDDFYEALYNVCGEIPYLKWLFGLIVDGKELPRKLTPLEELKQYIEYLNKFEEEN